MTLEPLARMIVSIGGVLFFGGIITLLVVWILFWFMWGDTMSKPGKIIKLQCDTCKYHDNADWICHCKFSKMHDKYTDAEDFCKEWWWKDEEKNGTRVPVWGKKTER